MMQVYYFLGMDSLVSELCPQHLALEADRPVHFCTELADVEAEKANTESRACTVVQKKESFYLETQEEDLCREGDA